MDVEKAKANQLANIEKRSGQSLAQLIARVQSSGLTKHGDVVALLKTELGMSHSDSRAIALHVQSLATAPSAAASTPDAAVDELFSGTRAGLRPICDALLEHLQSFGEFEIAPKKGYLSLRRAKQFASITPSTKSRLDVGIILKAAKGTSRLVSQPEKAMFPFKVGLTTVDDVDTELLGWLRSAFNAAG